MFKSECKKKQNDRRSGVIVIASHLQLIELGLILVSHHTKTLKKIFTASLVYYQHVKERMEKTANLLVVCSGTELKDIPMLLCC